MYSDPGNTDLYWKPTVPIRMYHHRDDELVPYANSQIAFNAFSTIGAKSRSERGPGVQLVAETVSIGISADESPENSGLFACLGEGPGLGGWERRD